MQAIILTGFARAGKDTIANFLCKEFGFKKVVHSDLITVELRKRHMKVSKPNMAVLGDILRKEKGMDAIAQLVWAFTKKKKYKKVVLVGARSWEEILYYKKRINGMKLIAINAPIDLRFKRRPNKKMNLKDFKKRDRVDIKNKGMDKVIARADFVLTNSGKLMDLKQKTRELMYKVYK
ncbi:MAG: hypothetical protein Q7S21_01600 [archaeon]|nr:hypothetical protein [archaeon]